MPILQLENGTILTITDITPSHLTEFEDHLLTTNLIPSSLQTLATQFPSFITREQILLTIDKCTQFTAANEFNKVCLLAIYVQQIIKTRTKTIEICNTKNEFTTEYKQLTQKINDILQLGIDMPCFNAIKGYYFIFLGKYDNATFLLERNGGNIGDVGLKIVNAEFGRLSRGHEVIDEICNWYIDRRNRCEFDKVQYNKLKTSFPEMEILEKEGMSFDSIMDLLENTESEDVLFKYKNVDCESFMSDWNYYVGKYYHKNFNYMKAGEYYKKSEHPSAVYNFMRITRKPINTDAKYRDILNYIYLINGEDDKIYVDDQTAPVYRIKKSEKWCGNAVIGYLELLDSDSISKNIVVGNLVYFYYKCLMENEIKILEDLCKKLDEKYGNIKHRLSKNLNTKFADIDLMKDVKSNICYADDEYNGINSKLLHMCNQHLALFLCEFEDDVSLYNLSFLLKCEPAIRILKCIKNPSAEALLKLSYLTNSLDFISQIVAKNEALATLFIGYYHLKHENIKHAKESFTSLIQKDDQKLKYYGYLALAYIHSNHNKKMHHETILEYLKLGLQACKNSLAIAYNIGVVMANNGKKEIAVKILTSIIEDERNGECIVGFCEDALKFLEIRSINNNDNVEKIKRIKGAK